MSIRAILFDAGNTLVSIDPHRMVDLLRDHGAVLDVQKFREAEAEARRTLHRKVREGHAGTEPEVWREYFATLFLDSGVPRDALAAVGRRVREVHAENHLWTGMDPGTPAVLSDLLDRGYRLAVISNADGRVEDALGRVGLTRFFEFVLDSQVVGIEKPDPRIFLEACGRMGLPPDGCLYVGDLYPVDYQGAMGAGMHAVLLDPLGMQDGDVVRITSLEELAPLVGSHAFDGGQPAAGITPHAPGIR